MIKYVSFFLLFVCNVFGQYDFGPFAERDPYEDAPEISFVTIVLIVLAILYYNRNKENNDEL